MIIDQKCNCVYGVKVFSHAYTIFTVLLVYLFKDVVLFDFVAQFQHFGSVF